MINLYIEDKKEEEMLTWSIVFLIVAIVAGLFGFRGVEGVSIQIAKVLFFIFVVLFIVSLILGFVVVRAPV